MKENWLAASVAVGIAFGATSVAAQTFPDFQGKDEYIVTSPNATGLVIDTLFIPKGKTIRLAPDVQKVSWTVSHLVVEEDATFDLSAPQDVPPKAAAGGGPPTQPGYCVPGRTGYAGDVGVGGHNGIELVINEIQDFQVKGSLWVRTDGSKGGDGGNGGPGGTGGGHYSHWPDSSCGAGPGGAGGAAGAGGNGGNTSKVIFLKAKDGTPYGFPNGEAIECGRSSRPSAASGKSGVIAVYGGRGCSGSPGVPGNTGPHGLL